MSDVPNTDRKFETNFRLLEQIKTQFESESVGIDELIPRAREAAQAAEVCYTVLKQCDEGIVELTRKFDAIAADNRGTTGPATPPQAS